VAQSVVFCVVISRSFIDILAFLFYCSQILAILFRPFGFISYRYGSKKTKGPKQDSQNLGARKQKGILLRSFSFLAPRFWLSCLGSLILLLPDFGYPV
jgi:hypothetical protein